MPGAPQSWVRRVSRVRGVNSCFRPRAPGRLPLVKLPWVTVYNAGPFADRLLVISGGRIVHEVSAAEADRAVIGGWMAAGR